MKILLQSKLFPASAQFFQQMIIPANIETTRKFYPTDEELIDDIAKAYRKVIMIYMKSM